MRFLALIVIPNLLCVGMGGPNCSPGPETHINSFKNRIYVPCKVNEYVCSHGWRKGGCRFCQHFPNQFCIIVYEIAKLFLCEWFIHHCIISGQWVSRGSNNSLTSWRITYRPISSCYWSWTCNKNLQMLYVYVFNFLFCYMLFWSNKQVVSFWSNHSPSWSVRVV